MSNVVDFPRPFFGGIQAPEQQACITEGLKTIFKRYTNPPPLLRRGRQLYIPYADGQGAYKANGTDVVSFIQTYFEVEDYGTKKTMYRRVLPETKAWLLHNAPEVIPKYDGTIHVPEFMLIDEEDDGGQQHQRLHLISTPGYSAEAKCIYAPGPGLGQIDFSKDMFLSARAAYEFLRHEWLADLAVGSGEDPVDDAANECALLSMLMAPALKRQLGTVPGFLMMATDPSAGKTFWATCLGYLYSGKMPAVLGWDSDRELEWALAPTLKEEPPVIIIDNVKSKVQSALLDRLLTADFISLRGVQAKQESYRNSAVLCLTLNNPELDHDALTRFLHIHVRRHHSADTGQYTHPDMTKWMACNRHRLLGAIFQLVRAGHAWVDPSDLQLEAVPTMDKYPRWTPVMWSICQAVGLRGFLARRASDVATSDEHRDIATLLESLGKVKAKWRAEEIRDFILTLRNHDSTALIGLPFFVPVRMSPEVVYSFDPGAFGRWVSQKGSFNYGGLKIARQRSNGQTLYVVSHHG